MIQKIKALNYQMSLEEEFVLQKNIKYIKEITNIKELKSFATNLIRTNSKQNHFISASLEIICDQQDLIFDYQRKLKKKNATFWGRIKYVLFGRD
tara:strand:+ start:144 stop:428 length:285 start_codon:yes stop_codon:yes gene_type:complete